MKRCLLAVLAVPLVGCSLAATTSSAGGTSPAGASAERGRTYTLPSLFRLTMEEAAAALRRAGHSGDVSERSGDLCGSEVDGQIIERGQICRQFPYPGKVGLVRVSVTVTVQSEDPRHGNIGKHTEWHLMPDLRGLSEQEARKALHDVGLTTDDKTDVTTVDEPGCDQGKVCRTSPKAMERAGLGSTRLLYIGVQPGGQ